QFEDCQKVSLQILKVKDLPENIRECVESNLGFANAKLIEACDPIPENAKKLQEIEAAD
nr:hypothetical protein [Parachlamydiaceae bacterium]